MEENTDGDEYKNIYKSVIKSFEEEFTSLKAFLKYRVKVTR